MAEQTTRCGDPNALSEGIRNNENWAFTCLFRECFPNVAAWKGFGNGSQELVQDLFQDALIRLRGVLLRRTEGIENPCGYLFKTVQRDFYRQQNADKNMEEYRDEFPDQLDFEDTGGDFSPADWEQAYDCILNLGKQEQKLLFMTFFNKFPDEQIASALGYRSLESLRAARSRAMGKLRGCLKNQNHR